MAEANWTSPAEIAAQLGRLWDQGRILGARIDGTALFPFSLRLRRPDAAALGDRFDEVRRWIRALEEGSREHTGAGYRIEWTEINHRQLGRNRVPSGVVVDTEGDALALLGKRRQAERFSAQATATIAEFPPLREWIAGSPLKLLEAANEWDRIVAVLRWFRDHPGSRLYLRELDVPSVDTKFIESRRALFIELLDAVLPAECVDSAALGAKAFERRYGLRSKPALLRLRILDERKQLHGLCDVTAPAAELARLDAEVTSGFQRVFITENEINGLAFPAVADSLVIFGLGYSLERLRDVPWLRAKQLFYWGDIDTHGFAILDRLRASFPSVRSFLMEREVLLAHRALWVFEAERHDQPLSRLTDEESALHEDLRADRLGNRVRLEQERVSFGWVERVVAGIAGGG